jgi:hypothetical protein
MTKRKDPTYGLRTITPEEAREMRAASKRKNRKVPQYNVRKFAAVMKAGNWNPYNSTAISRDWNGDLINGHTRLEACELAGVPFTTLFLDGVDPATFSEEDTGKSRTPGDFFSITGAVDYAQAGTLAAAARALTMFDRGMWRYAGSPQVGSRYAAAVVTNDQLMDTFRRRSLLKKGVAAVWAKRRLVHKYPIGLLGAFWVLTHGNPAHEAFWGELVDGLEIAPDSPVKILRDRVASAEAKGQRVKPVYFLALLTKVWNAYQAGEKIGKLFWMRGRGEDFPEPVTKLKPAFPDYAAALGEAEEVASEAA